MEPALSTNDSKPVNLSYKSGEIGARVLAFRKCCKADPGRIELSEWLLPLALLVVGASILFRPMALVDSHMSMIGERMPYWVFSGLCMTLGAARLVTTYHRSPTVLSFRLRSILAGLTACLWGDMCLSMISKYSLSTLPPGFYMVLILQFVQDICLAVTIHFHFKRLCDKGIIL